MAAARASLRRDEGGFAIVEMVIAGVVLIAIAAGAFGVLESSARSTAEDRHRAQAHGVAQEDQARLRSFRIDVLSNYTENRTVTIDDTPYTVSSSGAFVTDATGTASCTQGSASADYIKITSSVTWPSRGARPAVLLQSVVAPPNGTISPDRGTLAVAIQGAQSQGIAGVGLSGSGAGTFSGATAANGCAIFGNLPAGNYTLTPAPAGLVDKDGDPPAPQTVSVVALSTNTVVLQYDQPGSVDVTFTTKVGGSLVPASIDSVVVFNTGMTDAEVFGTPNSPASTVTATLLFPFAAPNTIYAGSCTANNPNPLDEDNPPGAAAMASVAIPPGGLTAASVQLPALHLTAWSGTGTGSPGTPVSNARVTVSDDFCDVAGVPVKRTFTTNAAGQLPSPGLPWSTFDVCVDDGTKQVTTNDLVVQDLDVGTTLDVYLGGGTAGTCP